MSEETITYNIHVDTTTTAENIRELNNLMTLYLALSRRMGLPPEITELIRKAQQGRIAIETLIRSIQLFYATSGPLGWVLAAGGLALSALMLVDTFEARSPEY